MPTINFPEKLIKKFERRARRFFPAEEVAVMIGMVDGGTIDIISLEFPRKSEVVLRNSEEIQFKQSFLNRVVEQAEAIGLSLVGDIHSHCWEGAEEFGDITSPSETDLECAASYRKYYKTYKVFGILGLSDKIPHEAKLSIYPADTARKYKINVK